jgi:hypothetical protein
MKRQPQERQHSARHSRASVRDAGPTAPGEGYIIFCTKDRDRRSRVGAGPQDKSTGDASFWEVRAIGETVASSARLASHCLRLATRIRVTPTQ